MRRVLLAVVAACIFVPAFGQKDDISRYRKAAEQGIPKGYYNMGVCYEKGYEVDVDFKQAIEWYTLAADSGYASAQYNLAQMYYDGRGTARDYAKAADLYAKAASQGHVKAQYNLGLCYHEGKGMQKNDTLARHWLGLAADSGQVDAMYVLAGIYAGMYDTTWAIMWYSRAADEKYVKAQAAAAIMLLAVGDTASVRLAVGYLKEAAATGNALAQEVLGTCYYTGRGVDTNYDEAYRLFSLAAGSGNTEAMTNLGVCMQNGHGTSVRQKEAFKLYDKAARRGNAKAQYNLGLCYYYGTGVERNIRISRNWLELAQNNGALDGRTMHDIEVMLKRIEKEEKKLLETGVKD